MPFRKAGIERDHSAIERGRFGHLTLCLNQHGKTHQHVEIVGLKRKRPAIARLGFRSAACHAQDLTEIGVEMRCLAVKSDRAGDEIDSGVVASRLVRSDAQELQRVGMARLQCQDLSVERLGSSEIASLVVLQRLPEERCDLRALRGRKTGLRGGPAFLAIHERVATFLDVTTIWQ
jgi:hypothetical protein